MAERGSPPWPRNETRRGNAELARLSSSEAPPGLGPRPARPHRRGSTSVGGAGNVPAHTCRISRKESVRKTDNRLRRAREETKMGPRRPHRTCSTRTVLPIERSKGCDINDTPQSGRASDGPLRRDCIGSHRSGNGGRTTPRLQTNIEPSRTTQARPRAHEDIDPEPPRQTSSAEQTCARRRRRPSRAEPRR